MKKTMWAIKVGNKPIKVAWYTKDGKRIAAKATKTFKVKRKPKKHSSTYWRKKCVAWAKLQAKTRDNWIDQRTGEKVEGRNAHGSHIINEGTYPLMSAEPYNIITLSYRNHINWWHKSPHEASEWFDKKWPGRYKELREMAEEKRKHVVNWEAKYKSLR